MPFVSESLMAVTSQEMKGAHSRMLAMHAGVTGAQALYDKDHKNAARIYKAVENKLKEYNAEIAAVRDWMLVDGATLTARF